MTELELQLRDLAVHLDVPPAPPVAGAVRARIARARRHRRVLAIALAIGIFALAVAFAVPSSRASLLRFFHVRGATVTIVDKLPQLTPRAPLGTPVRMDAPPFRLLLPNGRRPEQVYVGDGGYWLRYRGLLLFEFESSDGATLIKKAALGRTDVEYVDVRGEPAIWIGSHRAANTFAHPDSSRTSSGPNASTRSLSTSMVPTTRRLESRTGTIISARVPSSVAR